MQEKKTLPTVAEELAGERIGEAIKILVQSADVVLSSGINLADFKQAFTQLERNNDLAQALPFASVLNAAHERKCRLRTAWAVLNLLEARKYQRDHAAEKPFIDYEQLRRMGLI